MIRYRLYVGLHSNVTGQDVTPEQYEAFLREHVAPTFSGFTSYAAEGYWLGVSEHTRIIEVLAQREDRSKVDAIAEQFAETFAQDSVLVTQEQVTSSYVAAPSRVARERAVA